MKTPVTILSGDDPYPEWSGYPDPADPDNFWIDDVTGERVSIDTGERTQVTIIE